jgi:spermidine/putrescine transport system ATP-binding protein
MVMSDRIGVMRAGRLVQVGTPEDIYTRPADKFVSEFVGEVNVIAVERDGANGRWRGLDVPGAFKVEAPPALDGATSAYVVVRPEFLRFVDGPAAAENRIEGVVYNEYALGSRIQYQVRVGDKVMILELSRANAWTGGLDVPVTIGWDARDAITVAG